MLFSKREETTINIFEIIRLARDNLSQRDLVFNEQCEIVLAILRSTGCVPVKRCNQNGGLHKLLSATLVTAYNLGEPIFVGTRKRSTFHDEGISTRYLEYLDNAVSNNLLFNKSRYKYARGDIHLGTLIKQFVSTPTSGNSSSSQPIC